jgi:hypothetical protein
MPWSFCYHAFVTLRDQFIAAVSNSPDVPNDLKDNARNVTALEQHEFDRTYIQFLDEQIELNARGEEWTSRLRRRREALHPFCNVSLLKGVVRVSNTEYRVEVQLADHRVIHWEKYETSG